MCVTFFFFREPACFLNPALDNRRYTLRPAAVTFPTTPGQVADIVKIGSAVDHSVVAQSGGVSEIFYPFDLTSHANLSTAMSPTGLEGKMVPL